MNNLKNCFCGGEPCEPFWYSESDGYIQGDYCYKIVCKKCSTTITGKTKEDAINNWNTNIDKQREKYLIHGHWIYLGGGLAKCSVCKWVVKDCYDQDNEDLFCRKCGAKMDESEEMDNNE